jgi:hypothetical protein
VQRDFWVHVVLYGFICLSAQGSIAQRRAFGRAGHDTDVESSQVICRHTSSETGMDTASLVQSERLHQSGGLVSGNRQEDHAVTLLSLPFSSMHDSPGPIPL